MNTKWYNMCLENGTNSNPMAFLERAEGTFGDPNEQKNARTLLSATKQRNDGYFSDFITKFQELLAQAGGEEWPQGVQVGTLEDSLNKEMQTRLVSYQLANPSYNTFRSACLSINAKLQAVRMRLRAGYQPTKTELDEDEDKSENARKTIDQLISNPSRQEINLIKESNIDQLHVNREEQRVNYALPAKSVNSEVKQLQSKMEIEPMMVDVQVNNIACKEALVDTGNTYYITIGEKTVRDLLLPTKKLSSHCAFRESVKT